MFSQTIFRFSPLGVLRVVGVVLFLALNCSAQTETSGAVRGTVIDASGAAVAGARVTVTSVTTGIRREISADEQGRFLAVGLPLGDDYVLSVSVNGFKPATSPKTAFRSGETATVNFALEVAAVDEIVTAVADTPAVVSDAPEISQSVDARRLTELPSNGRSLNRFALLDPRVRNTAGLGSDGSGAARLSINASSFRHTHYKLDGNANYESIFANAPQQQVSLAAVQEFKVMTNQYSAEYGGSSAGIVSTTTKSGGEQFHGQGFYFLRPSGIQARPPVANQGIPNQLQQFGGSIGGPILANKFNFFINYEQTRANRGAFIQSPTPGFFIGNLREHLALARFDYRFDETHSLSARVNGNYGTNNNTNDAVSGFTQPSAARLSVTQGVATQVTDRKIWGTRVNEFRFSYSNIVPSSSTALFPQVTVTRPNYATEGNSSFSAVRSQNFQAADVFAAQFGNHDLKFGADFIRTKARDYSFTQFGTYTFAPGPPTPNQTPIQYSQTFGVANFTYGQTLISGFVQDNWRIHPRVTLNLGLRYEHQSLTDDRNNVAPRFGFAWDVFGNGNTVVRGGAGVFYDQYYFYITRRFFTEGVNSPTASYTLRAGAAGFPTFPNSLVAPPGGATVAARNLYLSPDRRLNPYSGQFSFGIQQKLWNDWLLVIDAVHSRTLKQMRIRDINAPSPFPRTATGLIRSQAAADATRPVTTFGGVAVRNLAVVENSASSQYDALDLGLVKRFSNRYLIEAHYLYNSAMTDSMFFGEPNTGVPNDWAGNDRLERGPSDFHQRHRLVFQGLVELPFKFQVSSVVTIASGLPVDPRTGVDNNGDTLVVDRPVNPATGTVFGRNSFRGPVQASVDLSVVRRIPIRENIAIELRAEGFNLFNRSNLIRPNAVFGNGSTPAASFLAPVAGVSNSDPGRQFQFGARLIF